jgi:homospermidine synthase
LSIGETKKKISGQNATALQVTSAMIAGMKWAM